MSQITRHAFRCKLLWGFIRAILLIGPIVGAFAYALSTGQIQQKNEIAFGVVFTFTLIISLLNILCKFHKKTPLWVFLFFCMWFIKNVYIVIIIIGTCTILDELIAELFYNYYKDLHKFNKNYDKRSEIEKRYKYTQENKEE